MSREWRIAIWVALLLGAGLLIHLLNDILFPFVAGMVIAYLFDPLADRLEAKGVNRSAASVGIILMFFVVGGVGVALLAPLLQAQIVNLISLVPDIVETLRSRLEPLIADIQAELSAGAMAKAKNAAADFAGTMVKWFTGMLGRLFAGGIAFLNLISLLIVTPVVAFYLLRDWDDLVAKVDSLLPRNIAPTVREQVRAIDDTMAGFMRGQGLVCLVLMIYYGSALTLVGLNSGLIVGLIAGLISFIPYVGATVGLLVGIGVAVVQFNDWQPILLVAVVFVVGQTVESYFLTPKLVGEKVGLSPVTIMFALMAGGALFGFSGVLIAVPTAAVIGVLCRFAIGRYRESALYSGAGEDDGGSSSG